MLPPQDVLINLNNALKPTPPPAELDGDASLLSRPGAKMEIPVDKGSAFHDKWNFRQRLQKGFFGVSEPSKPWCQIGRTRYVSSIIWI
jgi:hypothetical protein